MWLLDTIQVEVSFYFSFRFGEKKKTKLLVFFPNIPLRNELNPYMGDKISSAAASSQFFSDGEESGVDTPNHSWMKVFIRENGIEPQRTV